MRKWLAILWVLLVVFCTDGRAHQISSAKDNQHPSAPVIPIADQQPNTSKSQPEKQEDIRADVKIVNPPQKDFYDKAPLWINLAIVLAALLTLWAIKRQADIMAQAAKDARESSVEAARIALATAKSAQKSADAALLNARAVINAERPWIIVQVKPLVGPAGGFTVHARNKGRTPAMITAVQMGCVAVKDISALPVTASYWPSNLMKDRIIIPGQPIRVIWFDGRSLKKTLGDKYPENPWDGQVFVFGKVTYRDLANPTPDEIHETRWIGLYQGPSGDEGDSIFSIQGIDIPDEYDRHT